MPEHTPAPTTSRAVYGFVMYLSFRMFFIVYVIWAMTPEEWLKSMGVTFLPQRYWAIAVPINFLTILTIFAFLIYPSLGHCMTPNHDDMRTIKDEIGNKRWSNGSSLRIEYVHEHECVCKNSMKCCKEYYESIEATSENKSITRLKDLEMWHVSAKLYLK